MREVLGLNDYLQTEAAIKPPAAVVRGYLKLEP